MSQLVKKTITVNVRKNSVVVGRTEKEVEMYERLYGKNRLAQLQNEADERAEKWRSLTPQQQLAELDRRLGKGIGAGKQRARIMDAINAPVNKKSEKVEKDVIGNIPYIKTKAKDRNKPHRHAK